MSTSLPSVPATPGTATPPADAPDRAAEKARRLRRAKRLEAAALPLAWLVVFTVFSVLEPEAFFSWSTISSLLASQTVLVVITLALIVPLTTGDFDLSVGSVVGLSAVTIALLNVNHGWPILAAIAAALVIGLVIGAINGALTVLLGIESLIVTLGMSTMVTGITLWASDASTITGVSQSLIDAVIRTRLAGIPVVFYYGILLTAAIWYVFQYTPLGQRLLVVGRNREVARLSGIRVGTLRWGALVTSATIAAFGGVLVVGTSGSAGPSTGLDLLLPAFAAAFLGSTTIRPGRFNPWGTVIAAYFLVTGITGLQLLGGQSFVQNLFYGGALIVAVAFSQILKMRRERRRA
ncbi:ABC transporter permease [Kineosporia succinea]|uniref:Ribose transport system permease protein n=1 Tax=Kineosporia succinea TaxID=84632 RepID=A0ABT9PC85_9ACTN|nr:ABC transporter permease [Kineosporia succinea]MDP9830320.1 ribose transport system permease protein [Kineosporia succinea]